MARSKSSKRWLSAHSSDIYVKQARVQNYRSRAAYKLLQIVSKDKLIRPGMVVVDLGAAPGGWAQVAAQQVGLKGKVIAADILAIKPIPGVELVCGDIHEQHVRERLLRVVGDLPVDLVMSDMAPNISGNRSIDQPRAMALAELSLDLVGQLLRCGGGLLIKVFQGEGIELLQRKLRKIFKTVVMRKPKASRVTSAEAYLVARGYTLGK